MFLLRPDPEYDESLESYVIRLAELNRFRTKKLFPHLARLLQKQNGKLAGSMPTELGRFNLYHANTSSSKRYWALHLLSDLCCKEHMPLLELAVLKVDRQFGDHHSALFWKGIEIPKVFFRSQGIPVCPKCLKDKAYVPVFWHITLVRACPRHDCALIFKCPECGLDVDYIRDNQLHSCQCGFEFSKATPKPTNPRITALARQIYGYEPETIGIDNLLYKGSTPEALFGAMLWFMQWVDKGGTSAIPDDADLLQHIEFFDDWPSRLFTRLDELAQAGIEYAERSMRETPFRSIFGSLLRVSRYLPDNRLETNAILKAVFSFLDLITFEEDHQFAEISQTLLDSFETCVILGIGTKQLARVIEDGLLHFCYTQKDNSPIRPDQPLFRLRDVFLLWSVRFQSKHSNRSLYLSRW